MLEPVKSERPLKSASVNVLTYIHKSGTAEQKKTIAEEFSRRENDLIGEVSLAKSKLRQLRRGMQEVNIEPRDTHNEDSY